MQETRSPTVEWMNERHNELVEDDDDDDESETPKNKRKKVGANPIENCDGDELEPRSIVV